MEAIGALQRVIVGTDVFDLLLNAHEATERSLRVRGFLSDGSTANRVVLDTHVGILDAVIKVRRGVGVVIPIVGTVDRSTTNSAVHEVVQLLHPIRVAARDAVGVRHQDFVCGRVVIDCRADES